MDEVCDWLNGDRDYSTGRVLYLKYGKDPTLISLFRTEKPTKVKSNRLFQVLRELWLNRDQRTRVKQNVPAEQKPNAASKAVIAPLSWRKNEKDKVLIALRKQWEPAFKGMKTLHAQLLLISDESERGRAAHRILDLDNICTAIYEKRDYYLQHGRLPDEREPEEVVDPTKYALRLETAKRYVRRYKSKLKRDPENEKHAALLKQYEQEVMYYRKKLKIDE